MEPENAPITFDTNSNSSTQLIQARVPLEDASEAFNTRDANGRAPIVIIPERLNRIQNPIVAAGGICLGIALFAILFLPSLAPTVVPLGIVVGLLLIILGVYRSFIVRIPEGVTALLSMGGRYIKTINSGPHIVAPWVVVSHLVTRREIPFDVPAESLPTKDDVRATVDFIVTFRIVEAYNFVYSISADDFDHVLLATCEERLRGVVREIDSTEVHDLVRHDFAELKEKINSDVARYGVEIQRVGVTFAQPPQDFLLSQEARQLAHLRQEEQIQRQALALRQVEDEEELALRRLQAEVRREKEALQVLMQKAEAQRLLVEFESYAEELRLQKLQERFNAYPLAAQFELERMRLDVARALAGNTRAFLQISRADDIPDAFISNSLLNYERLRALVDSEPAEKSEEAKPPETRPSKQ
jgi:regulator of protease activity HflC (stomatin/prohibitin superfamily)